MKKIALILALCMVFSLMAGCSGNQGDSDTPETTGGSLLEEILGDLLTQTYTFDCGVSVTAPVGMTEMDVEGYVAAMSGATVGFILLEENKSVNGLTNYNLEEYASLIVIANSLPRDFARDSQGNLYNTYINQVEGEDWIYYITVHETGGSFWMSQFTCKNAEYETYRELFAQWAAGMVLPQSEAPVAGSIETQVYSIDGFQLTAPANLPNVGMEGYNAYYINNEVGFVLLVENKAELGLEEYTLQDYAEALTQNNGYDPYVRNSYGVYATEYSYSASGYDFWYYTTVHETEDAFVMLQFLTMAELAEQYAPLFEQWSAGLTYTGQ